MAIGASLITFVAGTTIKSADVNSNFSNINTGTFASISSDLGLITSDGAGKLIFTKGPSAANQIMDWGQGYGLYSDNVGTFAGSTSRLWFAAPQTGQVGEMHFGPRSTSNGPLNWVRFLTNNVQINASAGGATPLGTFFLTGGMTASLDAGNIATDGLGTIFVKQQVAAGAPTAALAAGTALGVGAYKYVVTFVATLGAAETSVAAATVANITTTANNQAVNLTAIPTGPAGVTGKRNIYRTKVGGTAYFLLTTLNDNTTTSFSDTTADTSLTQAAPTHPTAGGQVWQSSAGATVQQHYSDGAVLFDSGNIFSNGNGKMTFTTPGSSGGTSGYDAIVLVAAPSSTYICNIGFADTSFAQGAGLYAYDVKNAAFIFTQGTVSGITFAGTVNAAAVVAGLGSPTNAVSFIASATNAQGNRVARIQNVATSGQNSDMFDLSRLTNQAQLFTFGIDSSNGFYLFDATGSAYVLQGMRPDKNVMTNRNGTLTAVAVYTGTNTPSGNGSTTPATGAIWVKA